MNNLLVLILISLIFINCKTNQISDTERNNLIKELDYINGIDQQYAGIPPQEWKDNYGYEKAWEIYLSKRDSIALDNQSRIKSIYKKYGYLGYDKVGETASHNFWISIQHADNDIKLQKKMLKAMKKEISKNNVSRSEYAMLEDRVNANQGKKQRFGTQLIYNEKAQAVPKNGLIDSVNIDKFRKEYDLNAYKDYLNEMTEMHFEMNKQGITEPQL